MDRDIDQVIAQIAARWPTVNSEQLRVAHPGADDDGIWFFTHPGTADEVQVESSTGAAPFLIESHHAGPQTVGTVDGTVALVAQRLGLLDRPV